jgi:hypothetical protein
MARTTQKVFLLRRVRVAMCESARLRAAERAELVVARVVAEQKLVVFPTLSWRWGLALAYTGPA